MFLGYKPDHILCSLPLGLNFDGRSAVIRSQQTHLTRALCRSMMAATNTTICVYNSGAVRLDDQLMGTISEYDILRCLPFKAELITIRVNSSVLVKVLNRGLMNINTGMFISYVGLEYNSIEEKWYLQSNQQLLDDDNLELIIVSIPYFHYNTELRSSSTILGNYTTMPRAFIDYLERTYPKPYHHKSS